MNLEKRRAAARASRASDPERHRAYNKKHRQKIGAGYHAQSKYGITPEVYRSLTEGIPCAVCGEDKKLVLDHDHKTGAARLGLCQRCNVLVGFIEKRPELVPQALAYLQRHTVLVSEADTERLKEAL
jgi:hypothetical protein